MASPPNKLEHQPSLPRTLSTSVLRIKSSRLTFWHKLWDDRSKRDYHGEDLIVTPFAQILASLRSVRNNFLSLTNVPLNKSRRSSGAASAATSQTRNLNPGDEAYMKLAMETMEELDWCLDQLETIQTHRSVSDMASLKVSFGKFIEFVVGFYIDFLFQQQYSHILIIRFGLANF
nr:cAMP-specific 3',5'-cyclic phosphodiesterase-like [Leptinotarsa decemlineata]